mmetsp:Transcript_3226/g.7218  ORF Transcript_3226/g.7218 Transcript_3226/m.7218 type:complete len:140 (-) Transcript_3226:787-1206(-)
MASAFAMYAEGANRMDGHSLRHLHSFVQRPSTVVAPSSSTIQGLPTPLPVNHKQCAPLMLFVHLQPLPRGGFVALAFSARNPCNIAPPSLPSSHRSNCARHRAKLWRSLCAEAAPTNAAYRCSPHLLFSFFGFLTKLSL